MATPTRFLSKCPVTFAGTESEEVELKDFAAFRNIKSDAVKKKQMERFRFVNSVIPLFIPPEHHTMWYFQNSSGSFWGDATHFLLCSKAHGFQLWKKFEEELRSMDAETSCRPHISASMTNRILQHTESGEDGFFALHDLVLLQLPFQPILLFQWLALSFCALMDFEHQMALLYGLPIPVKFKPHVLYLDKLMRSAQLNLGFLFDYLQRQIESEHDVFVGNLRAFELFLNEVIVFLRFQLCENGVEYAKDLVNKCWRNNWRPSKGKHFRLKKVENPLRNRNFLFNMNFWRGPRPGLKLFGSSDEQLLANDVILEKPSREEIIETLHFDFIPKVNDTVLKGIDVNVLIKEQGFLRRIRKLNQAGSMYNLLLKAL